MYVYRTALRESYNSSTWAGAVIPVDELFLCVKRSEHCDVRTQKRELAGIVGGVTEGVCREERAREWQTTCINKGDRKREREGATAIALCSMGRKREQR